MRYRYGVEIEFCVKPKNIDKLFEVLNCYGNILESDDGCYLTRDSSVVGDDDILDYGFEIKTRILDNKKVDFTAIAGLLNDLRPITYTNDTCSIHVHYSRPRCSLFDHYVILYNYLTHYHKREHLKIDGYEMFSEIYANLRKAKQKFVYNVNTCMRYGRKYTINEMWEDKSCLFKVHNIYNTIEYRGLRNHLLNDDLDRKILSRIKEFLETVAIVEMDKNLKKVFKFKN